MNQTKKAIVSLVILLAAAAGFLLLKKQSHSSEVELAVANSIPDIVLTEFYVEGSTVNFFEQPLEPGETHRFSVPQGNPGNAAVTAVDTHGGFYNSSITRAESTDTLHIEITMANRSVFENTIESGGEYWAGAGECTIRITNALRRRNIQRLTITTDTETTEDIPNILGEFVLFPEKTINVRVRPDNFTVTSEDDIGNSYTCNAVTTAPDRPVATCDISERFLVRSIRSSGNGKSSLLLCNSLGDWIITGLYKKLPEESSWGENYLTIGLEPKEYYLLLIDPGTFDIRVVDEDNDTYTLYGIVVPEEGTDRGITMSDLDPYIP